MQQIPVYAFTGFLDSGKTKFIQETLEDERFNAGERTLLLVFEEGEEEFDFSTYPHQHVFLEVLDQQTVTEKDFKALMKKYRPERIVAELNGMQLVGDLYARFPAEWAIAQEVMFADSTTFLAYNANMRNLVMDKLTGAQMVVFNRLDKDADVKPVRFERSGEAQVIDSGLVATRSARDIARLTLMCDRLARTDRQLGHWHRIALLLGALVSGACVLLGMTGNGISLAIAALQLALCLPVMILTRKNILDEQDQTKEYENRNRESVRTGVDDLL